MPELGFETIGNATVIAYDRGPILATDPWIAGPAYFGSWSLSHEIPEEQRRAVQQARYLWFSHGHPDHLNADSLALLRQNPDQKVLLADHYGHRICNDLRAQGFDVEIAPEREWLTLSDRVRVMCVSDYNQDSILLMDIGGTLVIDLNDAHERGWDGFVRRIARGYERSFLLALTGFGDAYMINYYDEDGEFIPPVAEARNPVGQQIASLGRRFGARFFVPFSSMHKYQRSDSVAMNRYATRLGDYAVGFESQTTELLPAFLRYDVLADRFEEIAPAEEPDRVIPCAEFGDDWDETLELADLEKIRAYFQSFARLHDTLDFVNFRVGGRDNVIEFARQGFHRGLTFEVPRGSLLQAVEYQVFDDLLIGNFMRTTLQGRWPSTQIYPDFEPYVTKYGDNGQARSAEELAAYFRHYRKRAPLEFLIHRFEERSREIFRNLVPEESGLYRIAKTSYGLAKRSGG